MKLMSFAEANNDLLPMLPYDTNGIEFFQELLEELSRVAQVRLG